MNSGLRKTHKFVWLVLAVIVPVLIIFSIKDLDVFVSNENDSLQFESAKSDVINTAENELIKASIVNIQNSYELEIILKSALKNPSSILYSLDEKEEKETVIGQIFSPGIYRYNIEKQLKGVMLFDAIKNERITKLIF